MASKEEYITVDGKTYKVLVDFTCGCETYKLIKDGDNTREVICHEGRWEWADDE